MSTRFTASAVFLGVATAVLAVAPVSASPGSNCVAGYMSDPNGTCWQSAGTSSPTVGGGPCMPGRVGTCLGYLANNPMQPGDTLPGPSLDTWP